MGKTARTAMALAIATILLLLAESPLAHLSGAASGMNAWLQRGDPAVGDEPAALAASFTPDVMQKGIDYWQWQPFSHPDSDRSLANVAATGANWINVNVMACQESITSTTVFTCTNTYFDADLVHLIDQAHSLGIRVMLKMQIVRLTDDPTHGPCDIGQAYTTEAQWGSWFDSYRQFVYRYAEFAQASGADQFSVGNEFGNTIHREADWRETISGVRQRFDGPLTYAALCYGQESEILWWDALDYIGVNFYRWLIDKKDPSVAELKDAWVPHLNELANLAAKWGKPVIFPEIGYCSRDGDSQTCWLHTGIKLDLQEQADCYQAAFESLYHQPWFEGMFWHQWPSDPFHGGPCDDFYSPFGKPAEDVLRAWYGGPPRSTPEPDYRQTMYVYSDALAPGWVEGSWGASYTLMAADQVFAGTSAISVTLGPWGAIHFRHPPFDTGPYHFLEFYVRGAEPGGQYLYTQCWVEDGSDLPGRPMAEDGRYVEGCGIEPGIWKRVLIPLSHLDAAGRSVTAVNVWEWTGQESASFWLDEIRFVGAVGISPWPVAYLPVVYRR